MKSKEEIRNKYCMPSDKRQMYLDVDLVAISDVENAMDEHAEQFAIEFAEFLSKYQFAEISKKWYLIRKLETGGDGFLYVDKSYDTQELINIFKKEKGL